MSLFKTKEWWRTTCGANETFDARSLLVLPLFGDVKKDILVVGSQSGYLRMYSPSAQWLEETKSPTDYKSTDLMVETRIADCIVDVKAGKLVSGSHETRLAVLTASKLIVYNLMVAEGPTEYGDRCDLKIAYEHALPRFPASLTVGPFGGVRGRDFLCVQCSDGTLLFYEQEIFAFSQVLKNRLLPEPIIYVPRNDVFVTASSSWFVECYRYQSMAESTRRKSRTAMEQPDDENDDGNDDKQRQQASLEPDWSYNIGEAVLDIQAVTLSSFEVGIVVLGEKHLYCLRDNCAAVKYAKRLEYRPLCLRAYVIEPDGKLMVLVIADTSTLMIYEGSTLKWSAQLPLAPVAVARAELQHLQGAIVALSEDGRLEACYLGSEPGLFVAPPLHPRGYDYAAAEHRLAELRALLKRSNKTSSADDGTSTATVDAELIVSVNVSPDLEPYARPAGLSGNDDQDNTAGGQQQFLCRVTIELSSYTTLRDVQICVHVCEPLVATRRFHVVPNLCDRHVAETTVYVDGDLPPVSSEIEVTVTYLTDDTSLRVVRRTAQLPLKMMLRSCPAENSASFTTIVKRSDPLVSFTQLFPEFVGDHVPRQSWNALGLRHAHTSETVTIVSGNASNRYRVQSNEGLFTTLVVQHLISRLKDRSTGSLATTVGQNHLQLVQSRMEAHFLSRKEVERITKELGLLTTQLRNVERKLLRATRERNGRPLGDTGLPYLLESTCRATFALLEELVRATAKRERTGHELWCSLRLLLLLLRLNATDEKYAGLEAAIGFRPRSFDQLVDWEEIADVALTTLLRSSSRKDARLTWGTIVGIASNKELTKLKKRLVHAIERIDGSRESDIPEVEAGDVIGDSSSA